MVFQEILNNYIEQLSCSAKELSEASKVSGSVISRYRSGEREPAFDSEQLVLLAQGLATLAQARGLTFDSAEEILDCFKQTLAKKINSSTSFSNKFNTLTDLLQINIKDFSAYINFETSYLYRIRSGQRHPNDPAAFIENLCRYIAINHSDVAGKTTITKLLGCSLDDIKDTSAYSLRIADWFSDETTIIPSSEDKQIASFLNRLDSFDLNEYIRSIRFNELKVPSIPFYRPASKSYYGIEEMKRGELDFLKATVLSKSKEPIFMCSDMPIAVLAEDMEFNKKWMFGIAMSLKKGLHLNIIHNIDRPFSEMMLGLEAWIPIYMTGQVSPYHFPNISTNVYHHTNSVSGTVALTGECIDGFHANGKYYLSCHKDEVAYFKQKAKDLLAKAKPLMQIYRQESREQYESFEKKLSTENGTRYFMLSAPPIYTISDGLLNRIFERLTLTRSFQDEIRSYIKSKRKQAHDLLNENKVNIRLAILSREEWQAHPVSLSLSGLFSETSLCYTYDEYLEHMEQTKVFAKENANFSLSFSDKLKFHNIQIQILDKKCIVISKEKAPTIHFIIRHRKMIDALYNFYIFES